MNTACHSCGLEITRLGSGYNCKICGHTFCHKCTSKVLVEGEYPFQTCKSCSQNYRKEFSRTDNSTPYTTPSISPVVSLTSSDSSVSCSGYVPADSEYRDSRDGALCTCLDHYGTMTSSNHQHSNGGKASPPNIQEGLTVPLPSIDDFNPRSIEMHNGQDSNGDIIGPHGNSVEDVRHKRSVEGIHLGENANVPRDQSSVLNWEMNNLLWMPPEPEDIEDDIDGSVANNDDDDEYGDGTKWGQLSSLSSLDGEQGVSLSYKEERQKAMIETLNGQFKFLVSRFLASEGIGSSNEEAGESWRDIVASLSWEAAFFVKPDAKEGRAMDPGFYVKIKCVACGSRSQSRVVKGLVFKKNTAHKHMPTKFTNPRLLLLKGVLGEHAAGLSSFHTMAQEKDNLKSVVDMIETCHPNVVLVEKTVSRDVQESLLAKGITLVLDMKLPRLERLARCTGSPIISSNDIGTNTKLRQCDSFYTEKFVEEHNHSADSGKKPSKTLMFFEGCPKPLGCTILLKGAHSDELKKVKRVLHYTVFAVYHLILETSFFADQRVISFDMPNVEGQHFCTNKLLSSISSGAVTNIEKSNPEVSLPPEYTVDIPLSDGSRQKPVLEGTQSKLDVDIEGASFSPGLPGFISDANSNGGLHHDEINRNGVFLPGNTHDSSMPLLLPSQLLSSISASLKKVLGDSLGLGSSGSYESISAYLGLKGNDPVHPSSAKSEIEATNKSDQERDDNRFSDIKIESVSDLNESLEHVADAGNTVEITQKGDIETMLDPQSILVLYSSRGILKDVVCEQSHLSRIKYYGNFDMSLGRFLQDILLSKKHNCAGCGEPPESHIYCYTHQNGKLTVQVKLLPPKSRLSGEEEGKIWMWTRCLKCHYESVIPSPTKRVVMSTAARGLSFGKFLELSFSSHSAARRLSRCGHLLHRDCLRFFGLGSKVAMFRYSPVEIYAACKPQPVLEFNNPKGQEWFEREARDVQQKGEKFFSEVASLLQKIKPRFCSQPINLPGSTREFTEVEEMLRREKSEFEALLLMPTSFNGALGQSATEVFDLAYLNQELLLELYVWDSRLRSLLSCAKDNEATLGASANQSVPANDISLDGIDERNTGQDNAKPVDLPGTVTPIKIEGCPSGASSLAENLSSLRFDQESKSTESFENARIDAFHLPDANVAEMPESGIPPKIHGTNGPLKNEGMTVPDLNSDLCSAPSSDNSPGSFPMHVDRDIAFLSGHSEPSEPTTDFVAEVGDRICSAQVPAGSMVFEQHPGTYVSMESVNSKLEGPEDWIWSPFSEIHKAFWKDYSGGHLRKFEFIRSYTPEYLPPVYQMAAQEREWLCYPVGTDGIVISVREEEVSSIIACALTLFRDQYITMESPADNSTENIQNLTTDGSVAASYLSSNGSLNVERIHSSQSLSSMSSDELSTLGSEGSSYVDRLLASENLHPEISLGVDKTTGKSKYSVVCIYAKQFYSLRWRCCPSELAYISSLSRCKKWDAQGGKSKALFAKTLDDRFIIKQIKKTELDSFLKFAPEYFKHISHSLSTGSQTCLAKILGIYQVRQIKGGKEIKMDLMVMENLLFGRNVSRTYDLKGAVFSRYVSDPNNPGTVLLDQNFVEDMGLSPMYIGGRTKHLLQRAIWNDTAFLTSINVMDYSLLVGVDKERRELVFGIIDYLRQYTWDKQLETWVKASLVVPKNSLPTVISPKEYKKRFRKFMSKYFITVPDGWSTKQCSDPCKFCTDSSRDSSQTRCGDLQGKSDHPSTGLLVAKV